MCVCVSPIPCLSVDNVSVTTTVPPTPTTQPITSHPPATPTLLTPSLAPDPKGNTLTVSTALHLFLRPSLLSFGVPCSFDDSQVAHTNIHTHTQRHTHPLLICNLPLPCMYISVRACGRLDVRRAQLPTLSLFLITGCLMLPIHTHNAQSAFVYVCVCVCVVEGMGHYRVSPSGNTLFGSAVLTGGCVGCLRVT